MYSNTQWLDEVTEYPYRYTEEEADDGSITHTPAHGETLQEGTPQSADNFNNIEMGVSGHDLALQILIVYIRQMGWTIEDLTEAVEDSEAIDEAVSALEDTIDDAVESLESADSDLLSKIQANAADIAELIEEHTPVTGTLDMERTNYSYPFPSDTIGMAWIGSSITTANYTVEFAIEEQDGCVGDIVIDSKTANGFYCHYTGSAKSATVSYKIRGGIIA